MKGPSWLAPPGSPGTHRIARNAAYLKALRNEALRLEAIGGKFAAPNGECVMPSKLEQLRAMSTVVSDTGDMESIRTFKPTDATTNPTLILKASQLPAYAHLVEEAVAWGRKNAASAGAVTDRLAVNFGAELTKIVPGRVSNEVDADLSFDTAAMIVKARSLIADYASRGVSHERILIKLASTWEGVQAATALQKDGIDCNMTLLFSMAQAIACANAHAFLISPFVGRILDWHTKNGGGPYTPETDPGVVSVRNIYAYYKAHGIATVVMGASFRSTGEIEALAGCDRLTIAPQLLDQLSKDDGALVRKMSPGDVKDAPPANTLDEKQFRWMMNEDPMATDKLAEGIRTFAKDLGSLRNLVNARLAAAA
jgi:transaldolase